MLDFVNTLYSKNKVNSKKNIKSIIPLNIFQSWKTLDLPPKMKDNVKLLQLQNPQFKYYLYDDNMCRNFISDYFHKDVVYAFNKLKPGAYKSDLWRYCVLFIHGGIYLDIKYHCTNNFKLIQLTDKEYLVRDRFWDNRLGIYQALIVSLPGNTILKKCIHQIVQYVKDDDIGLTFLSITGPHLINTFFKPKEIYAFGMYFKYNKYIYNKYNQIILKQYNDYRKEQSLVQPSYARQWNRIDIYNYIILKHKALNNLTRELKQNINGKGVEFVSYFPIIFKADENSNSIYIMWKRESSKSVNSIIKIDDELNTIKGDIYLQETDILVSGLNNIRIFRFQNEFYYLAYHFDATNKKPSLYSSKCIIKDYSYELAINSISSIMCDVNENHNIPTSSFLSYKDQLCIVSNWYPLEIAKIDYVSNTIKTIKIVDDIPFVFKKASSVTSACTYNDENWFVLYKTLSRKVNNTHTIQKHIHCFAVFDVDMNILRYSEYFKLGECDIQMCGGIIINNDEITLSYTLNDTQCFVAKYDIEYINKSLKWYTHVITTT